MFVITRKRDRSFAVGYLLVGVLLFGVTVFAQPGVYRGAFHVVKAIIETDETFAVINIDAETEPAWRWVGWLAPRYKYGSAEMTGLTEGDRAVHLDLVRGVWESGGNRGPLDVENLTRFVVKDPQTKTVDPELKSKVAGLLDLLHDMRDGNVPPPRHHYYGIKTPIEADIAHFALGGNYGIFAIIGWLGLWPVYLCLPRPRPPARWLTPRKAFVIAAGGVIALDLIFAGIHWLFSPGGTSEAMEFLIGMVNLPVMIFTGGSWVDLFPTGWAVSAVAWGVILSICVIFAKERRRGAGDSGEERAAEADCAGINADKR